MKHKQKLGKRAYDNASRAKKSSQNQKLIVETLVELLVERKGGEVTFEAIAKRAKISDRTIYRFFKDKEALHQEMDRYLLTYLQAGMEQLDTMDVAGFAKNAYALFDRHEPLLIAYLYSPFGQEARLMFRKKLNHFIIAKVMQQKKLTMTKDTEKKLAVVVSLVNAKIWHDIRSDFGYTGQEMGDTMKWAVDTLLNNI